MTPCAPTFKMPPTDALPLTLALPVAVTFVVLTPPVAATFPITIRFSLIVSACTDVAVNPAVKAMTANTAAVLFAFFIFMIIIPPIGQPFGSTSC